MGDPYVDGMLKIRFALIGFQSGDGLWVFSMGNRMTESLI